MNSGVSTRVRGMWAALLALTALGARAGAAAAGATPPPPPPPRTAATMLRFNTDKENLKIANRSLEFVNIIREDLRRNNDDYAAAGGGGGGGSGTHKRQSRLPARARDAPDRGGLTRLPPNHIPLTRDPIKRVTLKRNLPKIPMDARRNLNTTRNETTDKPNTQNVTIFRSYSYPMRHYKKVRVDKLKRLVDKGKRLRQLGRMPAGGAAPALSGGDAADNGNVNGETGQNAGNGASNVNGMNGANGANGASTGVGPDVGGEATLATPAQAATKQPAAAAAHSEERGRQAALRQHAAFVSPSPDQLDMAPARGPQIQLIRFKGRLCQRSVLNMEGPVYDVHGSTVVPPYRPEFGRGRQFHNTRAPDMILPRCCNCCKKSVLGCQ